LHVIQLLHITESLLKNTDALIFKSTFHATLSGSNLFTECWLQVLVRWAAYCTLNNRRLILTLKLFIMQADNNSEPRNVSARRLWRWNASSLLKAICCVHRYNTGTIRETNDDDDMWQVYHQGEISYWHLYQII